MNKFTAGSFTKHIFAYISIISIFLVASADALSYGEKTAESDQNVYFIEPRDNATVNREFKVIMGIRGMAIKPAGDATTNTGHHHLIIDESPIDTGEVIPNSPTHQHFGQGQTEAMLSLTPGKHTLILQFADGAHLSYGPAMRHTITVEVK